MTKENSNNQFKKIYLILWGICIAVAVLFFALHSFGFRLDKKLTPVKVGSISLRSNSSDFQMYLNNHERQLVLKDGSYNLQNITPGIHSIVISKDKFWPWAKTIAVSPNSTRSIYAFIFPMDGVTTEKIPQTSNEYFPALRKINQSVVPKLFSYSEKPNPDQSTADWVKRSVPNAKISSDKSTALYVEDNTIFVAWISETEAPPHYFCVENPCKSIMPVLVSTEEIKNLDFYKDRNDLVLFTTGSTIYAIEVDHEGTQNFQPIYKGVNPSFTADFSGKLLIKDGNDLLKATL